MSPPGGEGQDGVRIYTVDDLDTLLLVDLNRDGVVDDADTTELMGRLGL